VDLALHETAAVIVGASGTIGHAIATAFAAEGARIAAVDIHFPEHPSCGDGNFVADVTDYAAICQAIAEIRGRLGRIDHVVFAAAVGSGKYGSPFWNLEPADWDRVLRVNLVGAVNVAHAVAPALVEQKRGTMLCIGSVAGQIGSQTDPPYSASKAGLINFTQCAAKDLAPYGIRVNCLCPGMVRTPLNQSVWQAWADRQPHELRQDYETWAAEKIARLVPLNRWQSPEDIASLAVFLASDRAANITGQTINVDGGYVMRS
jgi:2-hydroxycyclohexanecarboxyl-CoA dehydrogenase